MFKAIILLTRRDDMTSEEFRTWWLEEHAAKARLLPGLRRLVFNVVDEGTTAVDGVSELWFDSRAAFEEAYASDIGREVAADSMAHVGSRQRLLVEERPQLG
jgi:uncharacterized protein (TIGR02118 family)